MADKTKPFAVPSSKSVNHSSKSKRPSTVAASSSRAPPQSMIKQKGPPRVVSKNKNTTISCEADTTISNVDLSSDISMEWDAIERQIAYGKFTRALLEECLVDEKIKREETEMDIQMTQLADRFQKTITQLDKTNQRLKDISFTVEHQRLLQLKSDDFTRFTQATDESNIETALKKMYVTEQSYLDQLETKNIDFGYNQESGHQQLSDAVTEALEGLEQIRKHSKLDIEKFKEYERSLSNLTELEKEKFDLERSKKEFEHEFPEVSDKLLLDFSEKMAKMIMNEDPDE